MLQDGTGKVASCNPACFRARFHESLITGVVLSDVHLWTELAGLYSQSPNLSTWIDTLVVSMSHQTMMAEM